MSEVLIPVHKFRRVFDYIEKIGLDVSDLERRANISYGRLKALPDEPGISAVHYSMLYKESVRLMQTMDLPVPWAAGIGSESFELMCHSMISCRTLGDALQRAARFDRLVYPLTRHRIDLQRDEDMARLSFEIDIDPVREAFAPENWDRAQYMETVSRASGLLIWYSFSGWLIGRSIEATELRIAAPYLNDAYRDSLERTLQCPITFDSGDNALIFPTSFLDYRLVHTPDSMGDFLDNAIYQLIMLDTRPASTSEAIKSLVSIDFEKGMPSFADVAESLHMSESSLRRRLLKENTTYQALKDQIRCDIAIRRLRDRDVKIADLADYLGFTEPSSFVRSFRNWTGSTPKAYRDNLAALA